MNPGKRNRLTPGCKEVSLTYWFAKHAVARTRTWDHLVNSEVLYHLSYDGSTHPKVVGSF